MKTVYREKRYYCGEYLDVYIYPTYRQGRSRGKRSKPTSAAQAKLNQRHREEKLVRLLHANFTPDDLEIHLTYQQQPESIRFRTTSTTATCPSKLSPRASW